MSRTTNCSLQYERREEHMPKRLSRNTIKKTGNDYVKQTVQGKKIKPGKGNCPANKHIKPKLKNMKP